MSEATVLLKAGIQACKGSNAKQCLAGLLRSGRSYGLASKLASSDTINESPEKNKPLISVVKYKKTGNSPEKK
ncbi:hypothetical protein [Pseudomonas sp. SWRI99]|uniref:hypothetical protein n=1 Tax=Pseudomonas sp. SWRI99 TaxID=2745506 RepID=UPI001646DE58|nr:hypothetical protein [Pseudomonas sp. SWRI99]MBC3776352.1 hypothetical protein [Pseudomonas sp. SWRI99]